MANHRGIFAKRNDLKRLNGWRIRGTLYSPRQDWRRCSHGENHRRYLKRSPVNSYCSSPAAPTPSSDYSWEWSSSWSSCPVDSCATHMAAIVETLLLSAWISNYWLVKLCNCITYHIVTLAKIPRNFIPLNFVTRTKNWNWKV